MQYKIAKRKTERVGSARVLRTNQGGREEEGGRRHRMHRCPAARVTGTGCNWTPITYVRAAGEIGKRKKKKNGDKSE